MEKAYGTTLVVCTTMMKLVGQVFQMGNLASKSQIIIRVFQKHSIMGM